MTPRDTDPLTVEERQPLRPNPTELEPADPVSILIGLLLVALSAALVAGLLGFAVGRASAAPRSAAPVIEAWRPIGASPSEADDRLQSPASRPSQAPSTNRNGPASGEPSPDPNISGDIITAAIGGQATWYCGGGSPCTVGYGPSDLIAAIDPTLGIERGELVTVRYRGRSVTVRIVDVCACGGSRIIDLSRLAFSQLADPSLGVIPVSVEFGGPSVTPPATDR